MVITTQSLILFMITSVIRTSIDIQTYLIDTTNLAPGHHRIVNIAIK